jgi:diaminopropionate ammonia-lyase
VLIKDESSRLGLPAFKILGASWAVYRALEKRLGQSLEPWLTIDELAERLAPIRPLTLVTATDGNHGRAVAHMAALLDLEAQIYVPAGTAQARIDGIASEGARVEIVDGTYDDAVAVPPGCECALPRHFRHFLARLRRGSPWVMEGYSTIMAEIDDELARQSDKNPELIAVQFGVGALAAAVVRHYHQPGRNECSTNP